jgi:RNA polymerase sigma-70 factor (ECF subfamily)
VSTPKANNGDEITLPVESDCDSGEGIAHHSQFVSLFARDSHRIFSFIFSLLHHRADAEDVFQRTSLILWQEFEKFDQRLEFAPWACGIAFYTVKNFRRVSARKRLTFNNELLEILADERVANQQSSDERIAVLDICLKKLSHSDRKLVDQAYQGTDTIKELASQFEQAAQTLYNRLNRIRRNLIECVDRTQATQLSDTL